MKKLFTTTALVAAFALTLGAGAGAARADNVQKSIMGVQAATAASLIGASAASVSLTGGSVIGGMIFVGALADIAYCQYKMKKDANGTVIYQSPDCNGGSPTPVVGNLTQNPYVTPPNPCNKVRGAYVCAR